MALNRRSFLTDGLALGAGLLGTADLVAKGSGVASATALSVVTHHWLSGASFGYGVLPVAAMRTLRRQPATFSRIWADASLAEMESLGMLEPFARAGWTGTLDIGCGGPQGGHTWASAANGSMDAVWRKQMATIRAKWGNLTQVHLSMAHESNGNWYAWSAQNGQETDFTTAWRRFYDLVQIELVAKGRNAKVTLNYNAESTNGLHIDSYWPGDAFVDIVGVNCYDGLGNHEATLPGWVSFVTAHGKPLSMPEWGLYPGEDRYVDNPGFITRMNAFFRSNASIMAGESYFNLRHSALTPSVGNSRNQYASLSWGA